MKHKSLIGMTICIMLISLLMASCATAITTAKNVPEYRLGSINDKPLIDFIGFKIDTNILSTANTATSVSEYDQAKLISQTQSLRQLGYNLETHRIANNKSDAYFGIYSLQEMELYKSDSRFVSFVEVSQTKLTYTDNAAKRSTQSGIGIGCLAGGGTFLVSGLAFSNLKGLEGMASAYKGVGGVTCLIGLPFIIAGMLPTKTTISFTGTYNAYLYDTQTKSLIRKDPITVFVNEEFEGSYSYDEASKEIVRNYISKHIYNEMLKEYEMLNKWVATK